MADARPPSQPLPHPSSAKAAKRTGEMSPSRRHGSLCADVKLFTALEWLPRRASSPTYSSNNSYCPPTAVQTQTPVLGMGGESPHPEPEPHAWHAAEGAAGAH